VDAVIKVLHTMKETLFLAKTDVILVLVLPDKSLVLIILVDAVIKVLPIMKEILSLAKTDVILVLALLDK